MSHLHEGIDHPLSEQLDSPVGEGLWQRAGKYVAGSIRTTEGRQRLLKKAGYLILHYRWLLMFVLSLFYVILELTEHLKNPHGFDMLFHAEFWLFSVVVPLLGGLTLTILARVDAERSQAVHHLDLKHDLSLQISAIRTWEALSNYLVRFPREIAPFHKISLMLYDDNREEFELVTSWNGAGVEESVSPFAINAGAFELKSELVTLTDEPLFPPSGKFTLYGLPLIHGKLLVALYLFYLPSRLSLSRDDIEFLNSIAPSIALAIDSLHPHGSRSIRAEAAATEQRRLSRYLHDTIAQDLGYIRLKLEYTQDEEILHDTSLLQRELAQLQTVADEAYKQIRDTMAALYPYDRRDLGAALIRQAKTDCNGDSDLDIALFSDGQERSLSPYQHRKILAIFREALANSRKHACASQFSIHLLWQPEYLTMTLRDEGKGFDMVEGRRSGGYGMKIMQERAQELNGTLSYQSCPDGGTAVILQVPLKKGA